MIQNFHARGERMCTYFSSHGVFCVCLCTIFYPQNREQFLPVEYILTGLSCNKTRKLCAISLAITTNKVKQVAAYCAALKVTHYLCFFCLSVISSITCKSIFIDRRLSTRTPPRAIHISTCLQRDPLCW